MKKLVSGILVTITILFVVLLISIMVLGTSAHRENRLLFIFDYSFSVIPSDSMIGDEDDSLHVGDIVIIKRSSFSDINIGDVIVYQDTVEINSVTKNLLVIHRVVGYHQDGGFETKGDNPENSIDPNPVTQENFQGEFQQKITFLRPLVNIVVNNRAIIFLVLFALLAVLLVLELAQIFKNINKAKAEKLKEKHLTEMATIKQKQQQELYEEILREEKDKQGLKN